MKQSLYKVSENRLNKLKNRGYDYKGKILKRTLSSYIYRDPKREEILDQFEKSLYFIVQQIKTIKTFFNYTVDKDYTDFN